MTKTVFQRIIDREIPADILYEDDLCLAFRDVSPQAPTHVLVIPKRAVRNLADMEDADAALMGHLLNAVRKAALKLGVADDGYRVVLNVGRDGGQSVDHLHFHLLAGRPLNWPPG